METVRERLEKKLVAHGMFENQAQEVLDVAIPRIKKFSEDYTITFDSPSSDYPSVLYNLLFIQIKPIALEWIDKNKPEAWFREMFV